MGLNVENLGFMRKNKGKIWDKASLHLMDTGIKCENITNYEN